MIIFNTRYILITSAAVGTKELIYVPHGYSIWHLNIALTEFPNNYLDTQNVLGNTEGRRRDTLKRETDIKAMQVHGKCWKK